MKLKIFKTKREASIAAAKNAAEILKRAVDSRGQANFVAATGKSQLEFLKHLVKDSSIDWSKTSLFHLDEYLGLSEMHPASLRRYLNDNLINKVNLGKMYLINGSSKNPAQECQRLNKIIIKKKIDIVFLGVGENGHLAFNDPPADFTTEKPFITVTLDEVNKKQQVKRGSFSDAAKVPKQAISMSIRQIMKSENIICLIFGKSKAEIVKDSFNKKITPLHPASILKKHNKATIYLDQASASLLKSFKMQLINYN